jgi:hypothetical protein
MAIARGINIVRDNLIFGYDTGYGVSNNSTATRFNKGEPTTNLRSSSQTGGQIGGMQGVSLTYVGEENGYSKYSMSGTFSSGTYPYCMYLANQSFTSGTAYSTQCKLKTNVPNKFNYIGGGINYVNVAMNNAGANSSVLQTDGSRLIKRQGFDYASTTTQPGYIHSNPINNTTFSSSTDFVYIKDFMIEQKDHCTPWTATSRSNTASLIDLKRTETLNLANVSFDSNAQLDFDGTDDKITGFDFNLEAMGTCTLEAIIYMDDLGGSDSSYSIFGGVATGNRHGYHEIRNSGSGWKMTHWTSSNGWRYANTALSAGQYYHVVWVWNGLNLSWYLNGVADGNYTFSTLSPYSLGTTTIGSFGSERYMDGEIPVAKIYQKALTVAEIKQNFNSYKNRFNI